MERDFLELVNVIYRTLEASLALDAEGLVAFAARPETGGLQASCSAFNQKTNPEQLGQTEIKGTHIEKQEVKLPVFKGDTILQT